MELEYYIDEEAQTVTVIDPNETTPDGEPLMVVYTMEEWNSLNG